MILGWSKKNRVSCYILLNSVGKYKFKSKGFQMNAAQWFLSNIAKDSLVDNMKKADTTDDSTDVDDILDIHKYLMKKHNMQ